MDSSENDNSKLKHPSGQNWKYGNEKEIQLFNYLLYQLEKNCLNEVVVLRVAGGWVRDQLLGKESNDIDICAEGIKLDKLESLLTNAKKESIPQSEQKKPNSTPRQIKSKPDLHKYIDTFTVKILGFSIEVSLLRTKPYTIKSEQCGTPEEDAFGRDLTINSLFFNLKTNEIEDWTKMGLDDLKKGIIRCPLDPLETFSTDPIRMLRSIRMACRFNYQMESTVVKAFKDLNLQSMLNSDISRERIYTEFMKIIMGPNYIRGIQFILNSNLHTCIFNIPESDRINSPKEWNEQTNQLSNSLFEKMIPHLHTNDSHLFSREVLIIGTILFPLMNDKTFEIPITKYSMREDWKWPNNLIDNVYNILKFSGEYGHLIQQHILNTVKIGLLLRDSGEKWAQTKILALEYSCLCKPTQQLEVKTIFEKGEEELKRLNFIGSFPVWNMPPLFKSEKLIEILNISGPKIKFNLDKMIEWQIINYTQEFFQQVSTCDTKLHVQCLDYLKKQN